MARILVVDDDPDIRDMLRRMLETAGYEVLDAPDGEEALTLTEMSHPDAIITDVLMPEKDGLETILELRRSAPDVKIIAISGGDRVPADNYLRTARRLGAQHTFSKPFRCKDLLNAVEALVPA